MAQVGLSFYIYESKFLIFLRSREEMETQVDRKYWLQEVEEERKPGPESHRQ